MSNISGKYAIVGVAETKVGKRPDASTHSLHLECIKACLDDAGIKAADVDGFITNQPLNDAHRSYAVRMANMARMHPNYATDLALGGATPIAMVQNAVMAIEAGMANTVMCVHARKRATPDPTPGHPIRHGGKNRGDTFPPSPITLLLRSATCTSSAPPAKTSRMSRWQRASMRA
jgi:acetyl-CoA acetyltransferase